jgi:hypothetical protein
MNKITTHNYFANAYFAIGSCRKKYIYWDIEELIAAKEQF